MVFLKSLKVFPKNFSLTWGVNSYTVYLLLDFYKDTHDILIIL